MIHYIDGKPAKNIKMNKTKRHAMANYRHTQRKKELKEFFLGLCVLVPFVAILATAFIVGTA